MYFFLQVVSRFFILPNSDLQPFWAPFNESLLQLICVLYSTPLNTGLSGIQMVIFRTQFVSGFQMVRISNVRDWTYLSGFQMVVIKA
jgi:hypothetical protein